MKEVKINSIEPVTGNIRKGLRNTGRPGFILDVTYTLADGRTVPSTVTSERKKDVLGRLEDARRAAAAGAMVATFDDGTFGEAGKFYGTVTRYEIGARGMVPWDGKVEEPEKPADILAVATA